MVHQFVFVPGAEDCKELWGQRSIRSKCLSVWIRGWWERSLVSLNHTISKKDHGSSDHQGNGHSGSSNHTIANKGYWSLGH